VRGLCAVALRLCRDIKLTVVCAEQLTSDAWSDATAEGGCVYHSLTDGTAKWRNIHTAMTETSKIDFLSTHIYRLTPVTLIHCLGDVNWSFLDEAASYMTIVTEITFNNLLLTVVSEHFL